MKFALQCLIGQREWESSSDVYAAMLAQADAAEDLGFEAIWIAEHHFTSYGTVPSPAVFGAAVAQRTKRLRIGIGISVLPFHDPRHVAEDYAMLDVLSGGRLDFGVGRGYQPAEFEAMGVSMAESRSRTAEALDIIEGLWTQDEFSYQGQHFAFENLTLRPKPIQSPPPIWMAAVSPETLEIAARAGRRILQGPQVTPLPIVKANYERYRSILAESGFDHTGFEMPMSKPVYCSATSDAARDEAAESIMWLQRMNAERMSGPKANDPSYAFYQKAQQRLTGADFENQRATGAQWADTPERLVPLVRELEDELGLTYLLCHMSPPGLACDLVIASMERFAKEVMTQFPNKAPAMGEPVRS
jgi:alkanesulfonate monooxygenase SsuD/methylene tetrahydromethanopterin reductase-like flavin-dependent oxidoreductase (luciferase family)